jgi:hypothetical protein
MSEVDDPLNSRRGIQTDDAATSATDQTYCPNVNAECYDSADQHVELSALSSAAT